jgi:hypothetical protein
MQDMDFAMSMVGGPQATDLFMGSLSVAQTVRDGIRQRGWGADDVRVQEFVDGLAARMVIQQGAPPSWGFAFAPTPAADLQHGVAESMRHPDVGRAFVLPSRGGQVDLTPLVAIAANGAGAGVVFNEEGKPVPPLTDAEKKELLRLLGPGAQPTFIKVHKIKEYTGGGQPECCVLTFDAPKEWAFQFKPMSSAKKKTTAARIGVSFNAEAEFSNAAPCWCPCCEYRQYAKLEGEFTQASVKKKLPPDDIRNAQKSEFVEDCRWDDETKAEDDPDRSGNVLYAKPPKGAKVKCAGVKEGDERWLGKSSYQTKKGMPNKDKSGRILEGECFFALEDHPNFTVDVPSTFKLRYDYIGVIWNVCPPGGPAQARRWHIKLSGKVSLSADGQTATVELDPPGGPGPGPAGGLPEKVPVWDPKGPDVGQDDLFGKPVTHGPGQGPVRLPDGDFAPSRLAPEANRPPWWKFR